MCVSVYFTNCGTTNDVPFNGSVGISGGQSSKQVQLYNCWLLFGAHLQMSYIKGILALSTQDSVRDDNYRASVWPAACANECGKKYILARYVFVTNYKWKLHIQHNESELCGQVHKL